MLNHILLQSSMVVSDAQALVTKEVLLGNPLQLNSLCTSGRFVTWSAKTAANMTLGVEILRFNGRKSRVRTTVGQVCSVKYTQRT